METIPGIISSAEAAWPRLIAFLQSHNINTQQLEQLFSNFDLGPLLTKVWENYAQIIQTSLTAVSSVASVLTITITGFVISIYILSNKKKLLSQVRSVLYAYVGRKYADKISEVAVLHQSNLLQLHLRAVRGGGDFRRDVLPCNEHPGAALLPGH